MTFGMVFAIVLLTLAALGLVAMLYDLTRFVIRRIRAAAEYISPPKDHLEAILFDD